MGSTTIDKPKPAQTYIPALDGLRAVSISLVLLSHLMIAGQAFSGHRSYFKEIGALGVSVFFVISGYLITSLLLHEEDKYNRINLKNFFVRRGLRLLPAFYFYLGVVYLLWLTGYVINIPWHDYVASILYIRNYFGRGYETGHIWSLSLEEQFYLCWPALLIFFSSRRLLLAGTFIVLVCLWRSLLVFTGRINEWQLLQRTDVRIDTILLGCCLAIVARSSSCEWLKRLLSRSEVAVAALVGLIVWNGAGGEEHSLFRFARHHDLGNAHLRVIVLGASQAGDRCRQNASDEADGVVRKTLLQPLSVAATVDCFRRFRVECDSLVPLESDLDHHCGRAIIRIHRKPLLRIKTWFEPHEPAVSREPQVGSIAWEPSLVGRPWAGALAVGETQPR